MTPPNGAGLRMAWERVRRRAIGHRRDEFGEPWMLAVSDPSGVVALRADADPPDAKPPVTVPPVTVPPVTVPPVTVPPVTVPPVTRRPDTVPAVAVPADGEEALVGALHRVADSFERVAESLDADRRERRGSLEGFDALLRELVTELRPPSAIPPVVVGGSIEPDALEGQLDLSQPEIAPNAKARTK
jgi:hypothetical protein